MPAGADPAQQFGVSTYATAPNQLTPLASTYDAARHRAVAQMPYFGWWDPVRGHHRPIRDGVMTAVRIA